MHCGENRKKSIRQVKKIWNVVISVKMMSKFRSNGKIGLIDIRGSDASVGMTSCERNWLVYNQLLKTPKFSWNLEKLNIASR